MTDKEKIMLNKAGKWIQENNPSNEFLVQLIELGFDFLNADTIPIYCKKNGISYNGAKKFRNIAKIRNVKYVIDNL